MNYNYAKEADHLSRVYLTAAQIDSLPPEAVCLLLSASVEKSIDAVFYLNDLTAVPKGFALPIFHERFVMHGGFPRGIEKKIADLYQMKDGKLDLLPDGGLKLAKEILNELHRTVKAWLIEKASKPES